MEIKVAKTEQLSSNMERWQISLPTAEFREFGFLLESMEGVGLHRRSLEADNRMEVDVAIGMKDELLALISALQQRG